MTASDTGSVRPIHQLNDVKTSDWNSEELHYHQRVMSDLSPWLNTQGTAILGQIITEIELRGGEKGENTNT